MAQQHIISQAVLEQIQSAFKPQRVSVAGACSAGIYAINIKVTSSYQIYVSGQPLSSEFAYHVQGTPFDCNTNVRTADGLLKAIAARVKIQRNYHNKIAEALDASYEALQPERTDAIATEEIQDDD